VAEVLNDDTLIAGTMYREWLERYPLLEEIVALNEVTWLNPAVQPVATVLPELDVGTGDVDAADARLKRFAPYIARAFPETAAAGGVIESPVRRIDTVWLKCDHALPISGSIKARGGIYEVLAYAERLLLEEERATDVTQIDYAALGEPAYREFFSRYSIAVGSTGNLGLSIGIMGAKIGFSVTVHMSADARRWKKDLLRSLGVTVIEYADDYSAAVAEGRRQAEADPHCHFVDDENSVTLFMGYAVAARRLAVQFVDAGVVVDADHPLYAYLPCGVGGGPGGVAFGLKLAFGDSVRCFFAEPTHSPAMLLGLYTGLHDEVCVQDFGIDNRTAADGLAVGRPSGFVGKRMHALIDGVFTVDDDTMFRELALLYRNEGIALEPSALAGIVGPPRITAALGRVRGSAGDAGAPIHLVWSTGGGMVPADQMAEYRETGERLLAGS
jgi:D-serine dehydratase